LALATLCIGFSSPASAQRQLLPHPVVLAGVSAELIDRLRADPFTYFVHQSRMDRAVCEAFADVTNPTIVRLHGDAHIEQFALTKGCVGPRRLRRFRTRGPRLSILSGSWARSISPARQRGWTRDRDQLWNRFFEGYRLGLSNPSFQPREPDIVRELRRHAPMTRAAYLSWGESQMQPMDDARSKAIVAGMEAFERLVRGERPDLAPGYFTVKRAGCCAWASAAPASMKVLIRVQGPHDRSGR
jgi:hypothetical protein